MIVGPDGGRHAAFRFVVGQFSTHLSVYVVLVLPFDVNTMWSPTALPLLSPPSSVTAVLNSTELKTVTSANQSTLTVLSPSFFSNDASRNLKRVLVEKSSENDSPSRRKNSLEYSSVPTTRPA